MAKGMYRAKVRLEMAGLQKLRTAGEAVLRDLDRPVLSVAQHIMDNAAFSVPRGGAPDDPLDLADTAFVALPHHNLTARLSTTATCGYAHPQAGPIHEGWHWGEMTHVPPHWLRNAAKRGARPLLRKLVAAQLWKTFNRLFSQ